MAPPWCVPAGPFVFGPAPPVSPEPFLPDNREANLYDERYNPSLLEAKVASISLENGGQDVVFSGGYDNAAGGWYTTIDGGSKRSLSGWYEWQAGD